MKDDDSHLASVYVRAGEQAIRLAANFVVYEEYERQYSDGGDLATRLLIDEEQASRAVGLMGWYIGEAKFRMASAIGRNGVGQGVPAYCRQVGRRGGGGARPSRAP